MDALLHGFEVALSGDNLLFVALGVLVGTIIGAIPGLGPAATIALLLPLTYNLSPTTSIIFLAGIYYGAMYGGRISSIMLGIPGDVPATVITFDGYPMAKQGRAGPALTVSAVAGFAGGCVSIAMLIFFAPKLGELAVHFGPPEYLAMTVLALFLVTSMGSQRFWKALIVGAFGLLLATVGQDPISGTARFTFGSVDLLGGIAFVPVVMGLFGVGEVLYNAETMAGGSPLAVLGRFWPTAEDWVRSRGAIVRGSVFGSLLGLLPGGGGELSSVTAYAIEKGRSKRKKEFGKGAIEGVAGPEAADNAGAIASFIPLLTLGLPTNVIMALLFGAFLLQGITPSPELISSHPDVFWGLLASMIIGNILLLILNLPLIRVFVQILRVRMAIMAPLIIVVTMVGAYILNNNVFDMWVMLIFGIIGYLMRKSGYNPAPLALTFVIGPIMERAFRQSLLMSNGSALIFVERPISGAIIGIGTLAVVGINLRRWRTRAPRPVEATPE